MRLRGFEEVKKESKVFMSADTILPTHGSESSAGYDFHSKEKVVINPGERHKFSTDIKAYMQENEFLALVIRSSVGMKKRMRLTNQVGVIDMDFYNNPTNDGNISIELHNISDKSVIIDVDDRICQGIFMNNLFADKGTFTKPENYVRTGGIGHTGK